MFRRDETRRAYNFYFSPEYDWYGEAIQFEKDRSYHIKMTDADSDWNPTTFGFDLIEVDNGTRVQFFIKIGQSAIITIDAHRIAGLSYSKV